METSTILVVGATGGIGSQLVPALRARGVRVRAMTRTPERAAALPDGVEPVLADLHDPHTIANALQPPRTALHQR
ncbi:dihydroflavonol-4-reductase [Sinosporangium album]|uniref:Dihydroflavonol-4-reductase n=1 Tax=Sinosporangium album TaxID=504805 RepID=A0A1G8I392_9ACTN|nr:NAD(P)H-binding protein [Sinosporangium album]SDI13398.1 dihydroflavonol-4-reductase [Sinosporangium album]